MEIPVQNGEKGGMMGHYILKLERGVAHIPEAGIFIPYSEHGGPAMKALNRLLVYYRYCNPGEGIPDDILRRGLEDSAIAKMLLTWMKQDSNNSDDQELEERFRARVRELSRTIGRIRLETEKRYLE